MEGIERKLDLFEHNSRNGTRHGRLEPEATTANQNQKETKFSIPYHCTGGPFLQPDHEGHTVMNVVEVARSLELQFKAMAVEGDHTACVWRVRQIVTDNAGYNTNENTGLKQLTESGQ